MDRRLFLQLGSASPMLPAVARAQVEADRNSSGRVAADADRQGQARTVGVSDTAYTVLTRDTGGDLFVIEQRNRRKGGPARHLHRGEDELFFVLSGTYVVEIGRDRVWLDVGDCVLGPRGIPHAWAFAGEADGRLLIAYAPAGKMEAFFNARAAHGLAPGQYSDPRSASDAAFLRAYGMELIGPPIAIDSLRRG